MEEGIHYCKTN